MLEESVNEWRNRRTLRQHQQNTKSDHYENEREQPEFLSHTQESPYFADDGHISLLKIGDAWIPNPVPVEYAGSNNSRLDGRI
jgi:hypothetical protein